VTAKSEAQRDYDTAYSRAYHAAHRDEQNAKARTRHAEHREEDCARARAYTAARRQPCVALRDLFYQSGCACCGIAYLPCIMSAHHLDPSAKDGSIVGIIDLDELLAELGKCIPLCHNCHKLLHHELHHGWSGRSIEHLLAHVREQIRSATP